MKPTPDTLRRENDQRANDLDIKRTLEGGLPPRQILLAALGLAEDIETDRACGWASDVGSAAIEFNALPDGWQLGVAIGGLAAETAPGIRFTAGELLTVVELARYFMAREAGADEPATSTEGAS